MAFSADRVTLDWRPRDGRNQKHGTQFNQYFNQQFNGQLNQQFDGQFNQQFDGQFNHAGQFNQQFNQQQFNQHIDGQVNQQFNHISTLQSTVQSSGQFNIQLISKSHRRRLRDRKVHILRAQANSNSLKDILFNRKEVDTLSPTKLVLPEILPSVRIMAPAPDYSPRVHTDVRDNADQAPLDTLSPLPSEQIASDTDWLDTLMVKPSDTRVLETLESHETHVLETQELRPTEVREYPTVDQEVDPRRCIGRGKGVHTTGKGYVHYDSADAASSDKSESNEFLFEERLEMLLDILHQDGAQAITYFEAHANDGIIVEGEYFDPDIVNAALETFKDDTWSGSAYNSDSINLVLHTLRRDGEVAEEQFSDCLTAGTGITIDGVTVDCVSLSSALRCWYDEIYR